MTPVPGDECLVVFADRCINSWWYQGGVQPPEEIRFHDLSDGFAFVGFRSLPRSFTVAPQPRLTSLDGETYIEMSGGGVITMSAPTKIAFNCPELQWTDGTNVTTFESGNITTNNDVIAGTIHLRTHVHSGVQTGSGDTGAPVP